MKKTKDSKSQTLKGIVVSDKMDKTIVVSVSRLVKHPLYGKFYTVNRKYKVHDVDNKYKTGDKVEIAPSRPMSKGKKFTTI